MDFKDVFIDPTEKFIAILGNDYLQNVIVKGDLSKGFAIVTDRRLYFKGTSFTYFGEKFRKTIDDKVVDLKDITGTGYQRSEPFWMIAVASLLILYFVAIFFLLLNNSNLYQFSIPRSFWGLSCGISFVISLILLVFYLINCKDFFQIAYAGGEICFETSGYKKEEIDEFHKKLRLSKDQVLKQ